MLVVRFLALVLILSVLSHPKDFYFWIILDGVLMYALVAVCNGLLYRRIMGAHAAVIR
jgi:hypothetical protein